MDVWIDLRWGWWETRAFRKQGAGSRGLQPVGRALDFVPSVLRSHRGF